MLNKGQQLVHDTIVYRYYNGEILSEFEGPAGSGKTYLIYEILKTLHLQPNQILAMAYTGAAALVLRKHGFKSASTIHSALYNLVEEPDFNNIDPLYGIPKKKYTFQKKVIIDPNIKVFLIDEAGMVPKSMVNDILSFGIPIIACGDLRQLSPVGDEPGFLISNDVLHLTEIMRQAEDDPIIYLAMRVLNDLPIHNGCYGNKVLVINDDELIPPMIGMSDVILCGTNKTREAMNSQVRNMAGFDSLLPKVGEIVVCRKNNWHKTNNDNITLVNGLRGVVINQVDYLDPIQKDRFNLSFLPEGAFDPFINLKANYEYFISNYEHKNKMKSMNLTYDPGDFFEYAYALTVHLSQGSEYNNGIYIEEMLRPQMQKALNYTAITRFKNKFIYIRHKNKYYNIPYSKK